MEIRKDWMDVTRTIFRAWLADKIPCFQRISRRLLLHQMPSLRRILEGFYREKGQIRIDFDPALKIPEIFLNKSCEVG
jgi:hypothetical protein